MIRDFRCREFVYISNNMKSQKNFVLKYLIDSNEEDELIMKCMNIYSRYLKFKQFKHSSFFFRESFQFHLRLVSKPIFYLYIIFYHYIKRSIYISIYFIFTFLTLKVSILLLRSFLQNLFEDSKEQVHSILHNLNMSSKYIPHYILLLFFCNKLYSSILVFV